MTPLWTTKFPKSLIGSVTPVFDATTNSVYVSDGWGTTTTAISLRRVSLTDGALTGAALVKGAVFSVALARVPNRVLVATGSRLLELDRITLKETARWDDRVPQYAHRMVCAGDYALMIGWAGPSLSLFDLRTGTVRRKKVGSCQGLFITKDGAALIASGKDGVVTRCDPQSAALKIVATPGPFIHADYDAVADLLVLGMGVPFEKTDTSISHHKRTDRLAVLRPGRGSSVVELKAPRTFDSLWLAGDGAHLFLAQDDTIQKCLLTDVGVTMVSEYRIPTPFKAWCFLREPAILLGADFKSREGALAAWQI